MDTFLSNYYNKIHKKKFFLITTSLFLLSQITIASLLHPLNTFTVLELQTTFSPERFLEIINHWKSNELIHWYYKHFYFDHIHPLWYSLFGSSLLAVTFNRNQVKLRAPIYLMTPFLAGLCDVIENLFHVWFLNDLTRVTDISILISAIFCWIKWILIATILGFCFVQWVKHVINR